MLTSTNDLVCRKGKARTLGKYTPKGKVPYLLLLIACQLPLLSIAQSVTLKGNNLTLHQVFTAVKKQTNYTVVYNAEVLNDKEKVNVAASNVPLTSFMKSVFAGKPYSFSIVGPNIVVFKKTVEKPLPPDTPVSRHISGLVYDQKTLLGIRGTSVVVSEGKLATQTDEQGRFTLKVPTGQITITVTCIGYEKSVIAVGPQRDHISVPLTVATMELDRAVVQAYSVTSKRLTTSNIGKVTGEEIRRQPVMNPLVALQGRVSGLTVLPSNGNANAPVKVEIRGRNNINPLVYSDPLYVIDGIPFTVLPLQTSFIFPGEGISPGITQAGVSNTGGQSPLFGLNSMDIESIEILKDGDATAIYGSRAANGVILITTKKAKAGKTSFNFGWTEGISFVPRHLDMLETAEYLAIRREAFSNDGITPNNQNAPDLTVWDSARNINWQQQIYGTGRSQRITAGLSGGDNRNAFRISAQYQKETPMLKSPGSNDIASFRLNTNHRSPNGKVTANVSVDYTYSKIKAYNEAGTVISLPPNAPAAFNSNGKLNYEAYGNAGQSAFPFAYLLRPGITTTNMLNSSVSIAYNIAGGVSVNLRGGFRTLNNTNDLFQPIASQDPRIRPTGLALFGETKNTNWLIEPQLHYSAFVGAGLLDVRVGAKLEKTITSGQTIDAMGYTNDALLTGLVGAAFTSIAKGRSIYKYNAAYARINYNWRQKYILNLNANRDGSSRFGPGRQFGNFGSVGLAWIASEEPWIKKAMPAWISFLKLRGSYAITGSDGVGDYQYLTRWGSADPNGFNAILQDYNGVRAYTSLQPVNQDYRWEANNQVDLSLNIGFINNKLLVDVGVFRKRSGNQITRLPTPAYSGFTRVVANWDDALVENAGIEGEISARIIETKNWGWTLNMNITSIRNKLVSYPGIESSPYATRYKVGNSLQTRYVLNFLGVDPLTGLYRYEDYNKDGLITERSDIPAGTLNDDRYLSIDLQPAYQGGFSSGLRYKNFQLNLSFSYIKQWVEDPFFSARPGMMKNFVYPAEMQQSTWRYPGDIADYAKITTGVNGLRKSKNSFTDGSYLRLQNVAVSWHLPERLLTKAKMTAATLSVFAQDIFTLTRFKGIDPRITNLYTLPMPAIITANLSITL